MQQDDFNEFLAKLLSARAAHPVREFKEILRLGEMLTEADIPHELRRHMMGGYQLTYYGHAGKPVAPAGHIYGAGMGAVCSAIETPMSYGNEKDLIEIQGLLTDKEYKETGRSVLGYLTAEDVFNRIKNHWESKAGD